MNSFGLVNITFVDGVLYFSEHYDNYTVDSQHIDQLFFDDSTTFGAIVDTIESTDYSTIIFTYTKSSAGAIEYIIDRLEGKSIILLTELIAEPWLVDYKSLKLIAIPSLSMINDVFSSNAINRHKYEELKSCADSIFDKSQSYIATMVNGYIAFKTGSYPPDIDNTFAKHVFVESTSAQLPIPYSSFMDINSAIITQDGFDISCISDSDFVLHVHKILDDYLLIDSDANSIIKANEMSYFEYFYNRDSLEKKFDTLFFLTIQSEKDYVCFVHDLDDFRDNGSVRGVNAYIVDECRWTGNCTLKKLCRYVVADDNRIYPCLTCKKSISSLYESNYEKLISASAMVDTVIAERKCANCRECFSCSKCSMLPEGITTEMYCNIHRSYPILNDYFFKKQFLRMLSQHSSLVQSNISDICFSGPYSPLVYSFGNNQLDRESYLRFATVFAFRIRENYYIFNPKTSEIIQTEEQLIFILEGYMFSSDEKQLSFDFSNKYHTEISETDKIVPQGIALLKKHEIIV